MADGDGGSSGTPEALNAIVAAGPTAVPYATAGPLSRATATALLAGTDITSATIAIIRCRCGG